jgi:uncharacterized membrane protein
MKRETLSYCIAAVVISALLGAFWGWFIGLFLPMTGLVFGLVLFVISSRVMVNMILLEEQMTDELEKNGWTNEL